MPGVLGRICHHPCETACKRNYYDEPVAIRPLHRVAYERYAEVREERVKPLPRTRDQEIAIIGSGPSGLTCALDLMRLGYGVTVYEKDHHAGGALYSGVPAYRLPRDVLKQEIDDLCTMGMDLRLNVAVGDDVPIDHLVGEYDAVLIAAGLQESRILPLARRRRRRASSERWTSSRPATGSTMPASRASAFWSSAAVTSPSTAPVSRSESAPPRSR